jgi:amino acid adenylation domain-containing protein
MLRQSLASPGDGVYVQQLVITFREPIDPALLLAAWDRILARHAILRTTFRILPTGEMIQEVVPPGTGGVHREDWSELPREESGRRLEAYLTEDRRRGFEPVSGPPSLGGTLPSGASASLPVDPAPWCRLSLFRCGERDWRCLWTSHHALLDGRSRRRLLEEWLGLYDARSAGIEPVAGSPPPLFADYARWLVAKDPTGSCRHFQELLSGFAEPTPLPMARRVARRLPSIPDGEPRHGSLDWTLDEAATEQLARRATDWGVSVHNLVQGAWAVLLGRFAGQEDVVFGGVRACRYSGPAGTDSLVGLLINTLPVRVRLPMAMLLPEWIKALHGQWRSLRDHETTPLAQIQAWSGLAAGQPLFESVVMFENSHLEEGLRALGGAWATRGFELSGTTAFPLVIAAFSGRHLRIQLTHDRGRIGDPEARRVGDALVQLLDQLAGKIFDTVGDWFDGAGVGGRCPAEPWNPAPEWVPLTDTIQGRFEEQAARAPAAVALVWSTTTWSYGELNAWANHWAHRLIALGVGPDLPVAICLERSPEWVALVLAVLKAGGAYLPLDPEYPPERLNFMLQDAGAAVWVTRSEFLSRIPDPGIPVLLIDGDTMGAVQAQAEATGTARQGNPPVRTTSENLACLLYTSGSTGQPKGVAVPQRGVIRLVVGADYVALDSTRTLLQLSPPTFDASTFELWGALLHGARCVLLPERIPTLAGLREALTTHRVDTLLLTSALFNLVVDEDLPMLRGVRQLLTGGEALSVAHVRRALEALPETTLVNGYGPTEATTFATTHRIPRDLPSDTESVPIGRPIRRTWVRILDRRHRLAPVGAIGELCIGGPGLAREYVNRPDLNAERFIGDPCGADPEARLYRTGDRARWQLDGTLEFLGRLDGQLKIRGHRIEPGEIEVALRAHPGVADAAVVGRELIAGDGLQLVAYVVPRDTGNPPSVEELRTHLLQRLPPYLCPASCVLLPELPRTDHGKVDRRRLPDPEPASIGFRSDRVATPGSLEDRIAVLFGELLGVPAVGLDDDFFRLGGHSLMAMRAVLRAREALGMDMDLATLFRAPTPAQLADCLRSTAGGTVGAPLVRVSRDPWYPLMRSQYSVWDLNHRYPNRRMVNIHRAYRLRGRLEIGALRDALQALLDRHEALRTRFLQLEGRPVQQVVSGMRFEFPQTDLGSLPADEPLREAHRRYESDLQQPFDLQGGRLFRGELLRLGPDDHVLLVGVHHLVFDGWSLGILCRDLGEAYAAFRNGGDWQPASLPFQPVDFASDEHRSLDGPDFRRQVEYWRQHLAGHPPRIGMPIDGPSPTFGDLQALRRVRNLPESLVSTLRKMGRQQGCTLSMTLFAVLNIVHFRITRGEDLVTGVPLAARHRPGSEGVVGCFRKRALLRMDLSGNPSFQQILRRVRHVFNGALAHQDASLENIFPHLDVEHPDHWVQSPIGFNFREGLDAEPHLPGLTVNLLDRSLFFVVSPMVLHVVANGDQVRLIAIARIGYYSVSAVEAFLEHYVTVLTRLVGDPDLRLRELAPV